MKKKKLVKKMSRRFLSGLLCVVLTAGSVMPMEMQVLASEVQTDENVDDIKTGDLEESDSALGEDSDSIIKSDLTEDLDLGKDSLNAEEDENEMETMPQEKEDEEKPVEEIDKAETESLPENEKEMPVDDENIDHVDSEKVENTDKVESTDSVDEADNAEEISTVQVQDTEVREEEIGKADEESTETIYDIEILESEEFQDMSEMETEVEAEEIDNGDSFEANGTNGVIRWTIKNGTLTVTISGTGTYEGVGTLNSPWQPYIKNGNITKVVINGSGHLTNASYLFSNLQNLETVTFTKFNVDQLTDVSYMFYNCPYLSTIDMSKLNGPKITTMQGMFERCNYLNNIDLSKLTNIKSVITMESMFEGCYSLSNITLGGNTANVINMSHMFDSCRISNADLSKLNTASVINMSYMFADSNLSNITFGGNTANVTNMSYMFSGCSNLKTIDLSGLDTKNVTSMQGMFYRCSYSSSSYFYGLENVIFGGDTAKVKDMSYMFGSCVKLNNVDLTTLDTSSVTTMASMFSGCTSLDTITFGSDTAKVTDMSAMFSSCTKLDNWDFENLNTENVLNMSSMFAGCTGMRELDISVLNTGNVRNMSRMFSGCTRAKKIKLDNDTKNAMDMSYMFYGCSSLEDVLFGSKFNADKVTTMFHMFDGCTKLQTLDLSTFNAVSVLTMSYMFSNCVSLISIDLNSFNANEVTNLSYLFNNCTSLKTLDLSTLNAKKAMDMSYMLYNCSGLQAADLTSFNTGSVVSMQFMMYNCSSLRTVDFSDFNTSKVTDMQSMLYNCGSLEQLDLTSFNTGKVQFMQFMFTNCGAMTTLELNADTFNTANVTNMQSMFAGCNRLKAVDTSKFNTAKVIYMQNMFSDCNSLEALDVTSFNTANVLNMREMFSRCNSLKALDVSKFNTSKITDMYGMFFLCMDLQKLDVSGFDTQNVTTMRDMFYSCQRLKELDLSNFNVAKVTDVWNMISECVGLEVIYTPINLNLILPLPVEYNDEGKKLDIWYENGGEKAEVTIMPQNLDHSIMLLKNKSFEYPCIIAQKEKTEYSRGEVLSVEDLKVIYYDKNGNPRVLTKEEYTTNEKDIDMRKEDVQELIVSYVNPEPNPEQGKEILTDSVNLYISGKIIVEISGIIMENSIYNAEMVSYQGDPVITDTTTNEIIDITEKDISLMYGYKGTLIDGTPYPYTQNGKPPVEAGRYVLVVAVEETNAFYTGTREIPFEIKKAEVTITAEDISLPKNFPQPQEYAYRVEGLFKEDALIKEPSFQCVVDMAKPNVYDIIPNGADAGRNYDIVYVGGFFTVINKRVVEISGIEIDSMVYNASPITYKGKPIAKVYDNDGNVTEEEVTEYIGTPIYTFSGMQADGTVYEETIEAPINAGSYTLNVKVSDDNEQYMGTTQYTFEIRKAPAIVKVNDVTVNVGGALPETYDYTIEGLLYNDKLVMEPSFRCNADTTQEGSYYIVPYNADAGMNYEVFYINGLVIVKTEGGLVVEDIPHQIYTGKAIKPEVRVFFDDGILLTPGKDYTIKYFNNINADSDIETQRRIGFNRDGRADDGFTKGMAYVVVTGKGNYAGTVYRNFYIDPLKISLDNVNEADDVVLKYTDQIIMNEKKAQKAFSSIKCKKSMKLNEDFELTLTTLKTTVDGEVLMAGNAFFEKGVPAIPANSQGTFQLVIKGINNYRGTIKKTIYVTDKAHLMKNAKITLGKNLKSVAYVSGGVRLTPAYYDESGTIHFVVSVGTFKDVSSLNDAFTVSMGKENLKYGADKNYTVKYKNNNKVGTATLIVEGKGNYMGTKSINFKVIGSPFSEKTININKFRDTMVYTGAECRQDDIELTDSNGNVINTSDYILSYKNNVKKGTANLTVTANPQSGYTGSIKKSYKITAADIATAATVVAKDKINDTIETSGEGGAYYLNGTVIYKIDGVKPIDRISLLLGAKRENPITLVENKDYTVKYTNNTSASEGAAPTMTITGKGNLTGTLTVTFRISKAPLKPGGSLSITTTEVPYNVKNQESYQYQPKIKVTDGKKALKEGTDYTVNGYVHCSQKEVQMYLQAKAENKPESVLQSLRPYAILTAAEGGNYTGTTEVDLAIYDTKIDAKTLYVVIVDDENYSQTTYTGTQVRPNVEVYYGTAKAVKEAKKAEITDSYTLTSKKGGYKLTKLKLKRGQNNGDYTLVYGENIKAGKNAGSVSVIGVGRYGGKVTTKFTIRGEDVFGSKVEPWSSFAEKLNIVLAQ